MDRAVTSGSRFVQGWNNRNPGKRLMLDNRHFTPLVKRNIGKPVRIGNGPCRICGGRHGNGPCPNRDGACFGCRGFGHHIRNCPNPRQNKSPRLPPPRNGNQTGAAQTANQNRPQAQGRVYAMARREAKNTLRVVIGTISLCNHAAYALFNPRASHSFILK